MSIEQFFNREGSSLLQALAVLAVMLAGFLLMFGQQQWAGRMLFLGVFLVVTSGIV